jgi:TPP-dependent pyruvate/acetoin dehydrogenase alpha subunit
MTQRITSPESLLTEWRAKDPIERLAAHVASEGVKPGELEDMWSRARQEMREAADQAEAADLPAAASLNDGVYAGST